MSQQQTETAEAQTASYKGFGSFHSDNVEDLIRVPAKLYRAPTYPECSTAFTPITEFGAPVKASHFSITPDFTFINHGAFGGALKESVTLKRQFEDLMEHQLLDFVDRKLLPWMVNSIRSMADFISCSPEDLVLVPNATYGVNAAMSIIDGADKVAYLDTEYGSVYKMLWFRAKATGASIHEIPINKHLHSSTLRSNEELTAHIERSLPEGCTAFVIDHITSTTALEFPVFTHIIPMLRRVGVKKIIVDGAHAPLQIDLNLNELPPAARPSVYVGNLHKWMSSAKSVGFMWVPKDVQELITPPVRSHGASEGFTSEFIWDGTRDYSASVAVPFLTQFWNTVGTDRVRDYCSTMVRDASAMLCKAFETQEVARRAPFMSLVRLPDVLHRGSRPSAKYVQDVLHEKYCIEVPVKNVDGVLYLRISAFVYNTMSDYEALRDAVLEIVESWNKRPRDEQNGNGGCPDARNDGGCGAGSLGGTKRTKGF